MTHTRAIGAGLIVVMSLLAVACRPRQALPRDSLTLALSPVAKAAIGSALENAFSAALPEMQVQVRELGFAAALSALQDGSADITLTFADVAYLSFTGEHTDHPYDHLRGIAALSTYPLYILVQKDSRLRSVADFQGRRVALGPLGGTTHISASSVLDGLKVSVVKFHAPLFEDAVAKLEAGSLDAVFAMGSQPFEPLRKALQDGVRLISLSEDAVTTLGTQFPFLKPSLVPTTMTGAAPVMGVGVNRVMLCREGLSPETVYRVTRAFFEALPQLSLIDQRLRETDVEDAKATPVPLHEGAARYYGSQN